MPPTSIPPPAWRCGSFPEGRHSTANYLLYVDGRVTGVVEAKSEGHTLTRPC